MSQHQCMKWTGNTSYPHTYHQPDCSVVDKVNCLNPKLYGFSEKFGNLRLNHAVRDL